jgi:catechol 2,3-dioxygenase-like lactoylglutathione lyase family enzyme
MKALAVHHVSINVADLDEAIAFYTKALGLAVRSDRPTSLGAGAWLDAGSQQIHLIEGPPPPAYGQHFALLVDDLDEAVAQLRRTGVTVSEPVAIGRARQAFLSDPSGNTIELHGR